MVKYIYIQQLGERRVRENLIADMKSSMTQEREKDGKYLF